MKIGGIKRTSDDLKSPYKYKNSIKKSDKERNTSTKDCTSCSNRSIKVTNRLSEHPCYFCKKFSHFKARKLA